MTSWGAPSLLCFIGLLLTPAWCAVATHVIWLQAHGKAEEDEREDGEITDSEKQVKAEEKKQKAREDAEAAQRELKV